jgi:hypothetical protein
MVVVLFYFVEYVMSLQDFCDSPEDLLNTNPELSQGNEASKWSRGRFEISHDPVHISGARPISQSERQLYLFIFSIKYISPVGHLRECTDILSIYNNLYSKNSCYTTWVRYNIFTSLAVTPRHPLPCSVSTLHLFGPV